MNEEKRAGALDRINMILDSLLVAILWFLCCLPIVTAGPASAAALSFYMGVDKITGSSFKRYFRAFGNSFRPGFAVWLVFLLLFAVLGADVYLCWTVMQGTAAAVMKIITVLLASATLSFYSVSVGVIARFRVSFAQCFRDTLLFILQKPGQAIAITLLTAVCIAGAAMLWPLAFLAAAPCFYLKSRCFDRLFADYLKSQKEKEINRK